MEWDTVFKIVCTVIASIGGIGAIIVAISKFLSEKIAERLQAKYQHNLTMTLEQFKSELTHKIYVTKSQYDLEVDLFRKLSKAFFQLLVVFAGIIECDKKGKNQNPNTNDIKGTVIRLIEKASDAQDILYENSIFIPVDIYQRYDKLNDRMNELFWTYYNKYFDQLKQGGSAHEIVTPEERTTYMSIKEELISINDSVREYLHTLHIVN